MSSILLADNGVSSGAAGLKSSADSTGTLALQTTTASGTATTAVLIDNAQNVGVGVTPSAWVGYKAFEFVSAGTSLWSAGAGDARLSSNTYYNGGYKFAASGVRAGLYNIDTSGTHSWNTSTASGTAGNAITFTQAMTLDTSNNLLLGTSSALPGGLVGLHINNPTAGITFGIGGAAKSYFYMSNTATSRWETITGVTIQVSSGNSAGVSLANGGTSWGSLSDERMKDIIEPIIDATTKVSGLRTVIGKYKTDADSVRRAFLIAQDVQAVLPEAVVESEEGNLILQYTETIPLLVAAIKEQQALIVSLREELDAVKTKVGT
jgi:Chaperone of endosialidase